MINAQDVRQSFRTGFWMQRKEILHGVSLNVPSRSVFGFLGANGAGKTTLIHLLVGLRRPVSGQITICGHPAGSRQARSKLGYLPERPYFYEHLTGRDMLSYFGTLSGMSRKIMRDRIPEVLKEVGLASAADLELRGYSKGMLQRIGIAQAVLHNPELLILDEPMSGLDPLGRKEMRELIVRLAGEGRTIFFSSHVIPDVEAICDQIGVIHQGRIIGSGTVQSFVQDQAGSSVTVAVRKIEHAQLQALLPTGLVPRKDADELLRFTLPEAAPLQSMLTQIIEKGGEIVAVTPERPSLEDLFMNTLKEARQ